MARVQHSIQNTSSKSSMYNARAPSEGRAVGTRGELGDCGVLSSVAIGVPSSGGDARHQSVREREIRYQQQCALERAACGKGLSLLEQRPPEESVGFGGSP